MGYVYRQQIVVIRVVLPLEIVHLDLECVAFISKALIFIFEYFPLKIHFLLELMVIVLGISKLLPM